MIENPTLCQKGQLHAHTADMNCMERMKMFRHDNDRSRLSGSGMNVVIWYDGLQ